ncbi:hypothetical protein [Burkholderia sp. TSV86]|uniref:hypothetical protein n=1 Tax=Burkholderia sp. TSV86 TaxID=1385594 RepID=UPI0012E36956|nr:hypothetical protein [Burkholderia sp. TSV86]
MINRRKFNPNFINNVKTSPKTVKKTGKKYKVAAAQRGRILSMALQPARGRDARHRRSTAGSIAGVIVQSLTLSYPNRSAPEVDRLGVQQRG